MSYLTHRRKAFRGGAFVPTDLTSLKVWLDASVGVKESDTTDAEAGDAVTAWEDQSGNGNDPTSVNGATFREGSDRLEMSGATQGVHFSSNPVQVSAVTVIVVVDTIDTIWMVGGGDLGNRYIGAARDGNTSANMSYTSGTPSYWADGVDTSAADRDDLHTAWSTDASSWLPCLMLT